jgi:hypothetical protein
MAPRTKPAKPTTCGVCAHPERARIEALRAGGVSYRVLSDKFVLSKDSLHRHWINHVAPERRAALIVGPVRLEDLANRAADEGKSLIDYLTIARSVLFNQFLLAAEVGDRNGVATVAGRLLECLREVGRLTGQLRDASATTINNSLNVNVIASPEFVALQSGLLQIARQHPGARGDIVALLRSLDAAPSAPHASRPMIECEAVDAA